MWKPMEEGNTLGQIGSEGGCIIADEEYNNFCRITLEKDGLIAPYSITCGIYGLMVHTAFAGDIDEAEQKYKEMKKELKGFLDSDDIDVWNWCKRSTDKW